METPSASCELETPLLNIYDKISYFERVKVRHPGCNGYRG